MAAHHADHVDLRLIDEIADRLVDRLGDAIVECVAKAIAAAKVAPQTLAATAWLDASEVAQRLHVDRDWVYEHAEELGVSRIGSGPRPRLRFPPNILDACSQTSARPEADSKKPTGLIPIRGQ